MLLKSERPYDVVNSEEYEIGRFVIIKDTIKIDDKEYPFSYERTDDSVVVVPVYGDKIVLINEYRHSLNEWYWEVPAGGLSGKSPAEAARCELMEEAGCVANHLIDLGKYPCSLGTSSSYVYLFVAECSSRGLQNLEKTELIRVEEVSIDEFEKMIATRIFVHTHGIVAWEMYKRMSKEERYKRAI